ncbi:MAG: SurA N-terminal domain-containing protein [Desulfuromusa sp.]|jgi:peptidyl-prolyl cis-trans isomerase SurA|nr:SurA N-terminal domain-containing protein [Desulfuromusa sp.]
MKHILFALFFSLLLAVTPVMAKTLSKVVAVVNDEIISSFQLDQAMVAALAQNPNKNQLTTEQFDQMKIQILKKMVNDKLLEQRSKELELKVSEPELSSAIEDVQLKNGLTPETLEQALVAQGLTMEKYRDQIKKEILRYKLLSREVNYKVLVTSSEVRAYFDKHIDEYRIEPKLRLNRISYKIPTDNEEQMAELRKQVDVSRDLLLNGEDFNKVLAAQGDSANGGDMGELVEADLAKPLQLALADLKAGGVSKPLEINGQIHLFQVTNRIFAEGNLFDRVKGEIEEKLKREKTDIRFEEWQKELRNNAHVEIRM